MTIAYNPRIVSDGLVLCLDAANARSYNEASSPTVWKDLSGYENNGTLRNSPTYTSSNSGSIIFDSINQDVNCGNDDSINFGTGDFTVSVWFKRFTNAATNLRLLSKSAGSDTANAANAGFAFFGSDSALSFSVNPTAARTIISAGNHSLNTWVNVVGVLERGASMRAYQNCTQTGYSASSALADPSGSVSGSTSLFLGSNIGTGLYWAGEISNVCLYNKALSVAEIQQNFVALRGRFDL
jgi:hypothetical protein